MLTSSLKGGLPPMLLQKSWPSLTDYQATSSGGLLPTRSGKLLNLILLNEHIGDTRQIHTKFQSTVNSAGMGFSLEFEGEGVDALLRLLGCVIISLMPEEGLEETLTALKENF